MEPVLFIYLISYLIFTALVFMAMALALSSNKNLNKKTFNDTNKIVQIANGSYYPVVEPIHSYQYKANHTWVLLDNGKCRISNQIITDTKKL